MADSDLPSAIRHPLFQLTPPNDNDSIHLPHFDLSRKPHSTEEVTGQAWRQEIPLEMNKGGSGFLSLSLKPGPNGWSEGDWKVEIFLNGTLAKTVEFKVAK
jgi:hypothetical protein